MASKATVRSAVDDQHTRGKISVSHQQLSDGWYVRVGFVLDDAGEGDQRDTCIIAIHKLSDRGRA